MQPNGTFNRVEIYAGSRHLATYDQVPQQTIFIHNDWQGTERVRSKYDGTSYETCSNLPFGDSQTCTVAGGAADPSPLHYTGKMRDVETNLDYFGARYYSNGMGHWMSPDWADKPTAVPYANFGDPQSLNLYAFVGGSPVSKQDSDGHELQTFQASNIVQATQIASAMGLMVGTVTQVTGNGNSSTSGGTAQAAAPSTSSSTQRQTAAASAGIVALPMFARAGVGALAGSEDGALGGSAEPGLGNLAGAAIGAAVGATVAVVAPQAFSKTKDELDKALTKLQTGIEHLGKLSNSPDQDPRGKWKGTVRKVADAIDAHADRMTGHQKMAQNLHEAADWLRGQID